MIMNNNNKHNIYYYHCAPGEDAAEPSGQRAGAPLVLPLPLRGPLFTTHVVFSTSYLIAYNDLVPSSYRLLLYTC